MMCGLPSLDNFALWGAKLHYFAMILGCIMPISLGNFVGYTAIHWAHYGSFESSGVDLAQTDSILQKKIHFVYFWILGRVQKVCCLGAAIKVGPTV